MAVHSAKALNSEEVAPKSWFCAGVENMVCGGANRDGYHDWRASVGG
jgi:hypothetical protein